MNIAFFLYTIFILLTCAVSASVALSAYFVSRRKLFLYACIGLLFYFVDMSLIFQYEFLNQSAQYSLANFYAIDHPIIKIIVSLGVLTPLWLAAVDYTNRDSFLLKWMPGTLFVVASALVVYVMPVSEFRQWLFYTLRQVFIVWVLLYVAYVYFTAKTDVLKARLLRLKVPLIALCALCVLITMEDVITILVIDSTTFAQNALLPLYVSERNFSENILLICTAGLTLYASAETLRLRYKEPPTSETLESTNYQMADLIPSFCEKHGLTPREQVILEEVLQEKDNQNIATSQQLALGTVKAHVHNILKKTGTSSRLELIQLFWSE